MWLDMMLCRVFSLSLLLVSLHIFYREGGGGATSACPVGCPARTHAHSDACALREPSGSVRPEQHPGRRYREKGKNSKDVKSSKHQTGKSYGSTSIERPSYAVKGKNLPSPG